MTILKCAKPTFFGGTAEDFESCQMNTTLSETKEKGQGQGPKQKFALPIHLKTACRVDFFGVKQSVYTEIKSLAVGLTSMHLHGFSLL